MAIVLRKSSAVGDTEVSKKIFSIGLMLLVLVYIYSGMYMTLENFKIDI